MSEISTSVFTISRTRYMRELSGVMLRKPVSWIPLAAAAVSAVIGLSDARFLYLAVIILFLTAPLILLTTYLFYALDPRTCLLCYFPQQIFISENTGDLRVKFMPVKGLDENNQETIIHEAPSPEILLQSEIADVFPAPDGIIVSGPEKHTFIIIPYDSFSSKEDILKTEKLLFRDL